jgi:transposase
MKGEDVMTIERMSDAHWVKVYAFLLECKHVNNYGEENMRRFVDAVLWVTRTGAQWRALPAEYGKWNSVFKRFARWSEAGVWEKLLEYMASDPDLEAVQVDSTSIRAHPAAAGAPAKKGDNNPKP